MQILVAFTFEQLHDYDKTMDQFTADLFKMGDAYDWTIVDVK